MIALPLAGRRVLVTRAAHQAGKLSEGLRELGAEPVEIPMLEIQPPESLDPLDRAIRSLGSYDWLILTSANTVRALEGRAQALGLQLAASDRLQVAAVGEATAQAARRAGLPVAVVPETYVAESLVVEILRAAQPGSPDVLKGHDFSCAANSDVTPASWPAVVRASSPAPLQMPSEPHEVSGHDFSRAETAPKTTGALAPEGSSDVLKGHDFSRAVTGRQESGALAPEGSFAGKRVLLARAAVARDVIPDALRAAGAAVDVVDAYRNVLPGDAPEMLREALQQGIAAATFTSSSSVTHLADAARRAGITFPFAGVAAVSIGPITSRTLRSLGCEPAAEADPSDILGLLEAVVRALQ
ncbi:MAG: uroporphyrinogen-III synthase [Terracidiphilus sp.]|jgi:uroporphyrinogen-III synthase